MSSKKFIATLLLAGFMLTGCGLQNGKAIIKINNQTITQKEFDNLMEQQIASSPFAAMGGDFAKNKDGIFYLMSEKTVLNHIIVKTLVEEELKNRGIKASSKEINKEINKVIDKMGSKDQLKNILKQNGITIKQFKEDIATQVKLKKLAKQSGSTSVSDKEVKDFYDKNKAMFTHKDLVRAYHILITTNPAQLEQEIKAAAKGKELKPEDVKSQIENKIKENRELASKLAKELKQDNSKFASYAKQYSQDYMSAQRGGDLGYFEKDKMVPEFSKAAFSAKPNTVTDPVQSPYGLHIIMVTDRKAAGTDAFEKVKEDIKTRLEMQKEAKAIDSVLEAAKKKAKIEYLDDSYNLDKVEEKLMKQLDGLKESMGVNPELTKKKK